ncbi:MAG: DUF115 domain-containing protein [Oscillospiraceae bacterium]|nr:DUF115 domain-containing protein [Oscillospiraceae bacterium]
MLLNKKIILFGAAHIGRLALHFYGAERVHCFADNNNHGQLLNGKCIVSFEDLLKIHKEFAVVITASSAISDIIKKQCQEHGIPCVLWGDIVTWRDYESNPEIYKFRNCHFGERCFLIGNGPSLRFADLDKLAENKIVSFGCNMIYKIFDKTHWRPDYFFAADQIFIRFSCEEVAKLDIKVKFINNPEQFLSIADSSAVSASLNRGNGCTYFFNRASSFSTNAFSFSEDASKALVWEGTVMSPMLQMAVYMGFKEIFLLGVDWSNVLKSGTITDTTTHFYEEDQQFNEQYDALRKGAVLQNMHEFAYNDYLNANEYCSLHGIKVLNATRGGKLDVFERVDFDSL